MSEYRAETCSKISNLIIQIPFERRIVYYFYFILFFGHKFTTGCIRSSLIQIQSQGLQSITSLDNFIMRLDNFIVSLDNFKSNLLLHDFNTRSNITFSVSKTFSVRKDVTYSNIKIFNYLTSNVLQLQENETLFKSTLRKYLLTHVFHSVEEFLVHKKIYKLIILLHAI